MSPVSPRAPRHPAFDPDPDAPTHVLLHRPEGLARQRHVPPHAPPKARTLTGAVLPSVIVAPDPDAQPKAAAPAERRSEPAADATREASNGTARSRAAAVVLGVTVVGLVAAGVRLFPELTQLVETLALVR